MPENVMDFALVKLVVVIICIPVLVLSHTKYIFASVIPSVVFI